MKRNLRNLILLYLGFVIVKAILSSFIPSSRALADDYQYLKMSESFFYHFNFKVHDTFSGQLYPLYPIFISIAQIFRENVYLAIKIINSFLSSLIIFPAYYLSREFLSEKKSLLASVFISLIPANFALTSYIMAENLFYSLFLTSIYFIYKSFKENKSKYYSLTILFSILSLSTRIHGLVLFALIFIIFSVNLLKKRGEIKRYLIIILILILILISWALYANFVIIQLYSNEALDLIKGGNYLAFIIKFISYFGFLLLSSGMILMLPFFISFKVKNFNLKLFRKIFLITTFITLFIATNHAINSPRYFYKIYDILLVSGRIIGRYVDFLLPLIIILSFIGLDYYFKNKERINHPLKKFIIISSLIMLITTSIILSPLVPLNNISLTVFGALRYSIDTLFYSKTSFDFGTTLASFLILSFIFILLPLINYHLLKRLNYRKFISVLLISIFLVSLVSLSIVYYAAKVSWYYNSEQRQLALYLNSIDKRRSLVLIDERDEGDLGGLEYNEKALYVGTEKNKYTILGYWLNDELIIGNVDNVIADYIISTYDLDSEKLFETSNGVKLYKK